MRIALCQMAVSPDMEKNQETVFAALTEAAGLGAELIVYPEICLHPFFPQYPGQDVRALGMPMGSPFLQRMQALCREHQILAAPNVYLIENGQFFDATVLIEKTGEILGAQKMVHIAQAKEFYEQDYYTPADDGFQVFETSVGNIGVVVCFDRHYPESIRTEALLGADLILIPTANVKAEPSEVFQWEIRIQAFQSSVAVAMCNRVGLEGNMDFSGESIVAGPDGGLIALADDRAQILYAELDLKESRKLRNRKPYTQLRRPEWYV